MTVGTLKEDIATILRSIARAESQRDGWQAAGQQERYLEACSAVDALQLQLQRRVNAAGPTPPAAQP